MRLTDGLVLTVFNAVVCLVLPRILSLLLSKEQKQQEELAPAKVSDRTSEVTELATDIA